MALWTHFASGHVNKYLKHLKPTNIQDKTPGPNHAPKMENSPLSALSNSYARKFSIFQRNVQ